MAVLAVAVIGGLLAAGSAEAAVPGLNISAYADAPVALEKGAKQVRFFVPWKNFEPVNRDDFTAAGPRAPTPLTADLKTRTDEVRAAGATPIMVILDAPDWAAASPGAHRRPRDPDEYAEFAGELAKWLRKPNVPAPAYEIWNEPDAPAFWGEAPDAAFYTLMLQKSHAAIRAGDPSAIVLTGPTTGNNYAWIEALYARGAKGSFDGVSVHTDTACSIVGPDAFYRDPNGRIGQFSFLGYREVRAAMLANGDDKPIWMTEIGWGTTSAVCASGDSAGKKAAGVSEAEQAAFLTKGFQCLANDTYVIAAAWFTLRDGAGNPYGLLRQDGTAKPALASFGTAGAQGAGECGDFKAPDLNVLAPTEGQQFVDKLDLKASATDGGVGVARVSYAYDGGKEIRNFTDALTDGATFGLAPWQGSGALAVGPHTIEVAALDKNGNVVTKAVKVAKVAPGSLASSLIPVFKLGKKPSCKKARGVTTCSFKGVLSRGAAGRPSLGGKVAVEWQWKNKKRQFRKLVGGLKPASKPFTFKAKLKRKGVWRVRVVYKGLAPYTAARSKYLTFRVR